MTKDKNGIIITEYSVVKVTDGRIGIVEIIEGDDLQVRFSFSRQIGESIQFEIFKASDVERIL